MSASYLLTSLAYRVPMLAVLIIGMILVGRAGRRIGGRSVVLGQLGLALLLIDTLVETAWQVAIPQLYSAFDSSAVSITQLYTLIGIVFAILSAGGTALLIAALVSRATPPPGPPAPYLPGPDRSFNYPA